MSINRALTLVAALGLAVLVTFGLLADMVADDAGAVTTQPVHGACFSSVSWLPTGRVAQGSWVVPTRCTDSACIPTYKLIFQGDGNLVLYVLPHGYADAADQVAVWSSGTWGHPQDFAYMQGDGNFVIYSRGYHPLWASSTAGCGNEESVVVSNTSPYVGLWVAQRSNLVAACTRRIGGL